MYKSQIRRDQFTDQTKKPLKMWWGVGIELSINDDTRRIELKLQFAKLT